MGTPAIRCKKCYGRGFYLKKDGFTLADRMKCDWCNGIGSVSEWLKPKKNKPKPEYRYSKQGEQL
jgi:DnaJ-class molecular chaperone